MGENVLTRGVRPQTVLRAMAAVVVVSILIVAVIIFVPPRNDGSIRLAPANASRVSLAGVFPPDGEHRLRNPLGIAISPNGRRLYVAESDAGKIRIYGADGKRYGVITLRGADDGRPAYPASIAALDRQRIAVVDNTTRQVQVFSTPWLCKPKLIQVLSGDTAPVHPTAVAAGPDGGLLVADGADHRIKLYDKSYRFVKSVGESGSMTYSGSIISAGERLYVSDVASSRVIVFGQSGANVERVFNDGVRVPKGQALDSWGRLLVADQYVPGVIAFTKDGKALGSITPSSTVSSTLVAPVGIAWLGKTKRAYVTDSVSGVVRVYNLRP